MITIDEVKKLNAERAQGDWLWDGKPWDYNPLEEAPWLVFYNGRYQQDIISGEIKCSEADANFIAAAPSIAQLCIAQAEEIERLRGALENIRSRASIPAGGKTVRWIATQALQEKPHDTSKPTNKIEG